MGRYGAGRMRQKILFVLTAIFICWGTSGFPAETLVIPGSGACEVLLQELAAAFNAKNPGQEVIIPPSIGTRGGILAVAHDEYLLGRVARPLDEMERGYGLGYLVFARDAVVFAVGAKVEIKSLTSGQLADIFTGKITNWQEVGGHQAPIRVLTRDPGETSLRSIRQQLKEFQNINFTPRSKTAHHDYEMLEMLQKFKNSIGFLTYSSTVGLDTSIKPIALDNIRPTPETVQAGQYKMLEDYALVYKEKRLNELARAFIKFIFSDEARDIMKKRGVIPADRD
jgi:phosphate transport system substrate-binding protein